MWSAAVVQLIGGKDSTIKTIAKIQRYWLFLLYFEEEPVGFFVLHYSLQECSTITLTGNDS